MAEQQVIPAKHGVATFVPAGSTIKIINTSGTQVIDTWAFALPKPEGKKGAEKEETQEKPEDKTEAPKQEEKPTQKAPPKKGKKDGDFPSQEDAEKATQEGLNKADEAGKDAKSATPQKSTWSSYVPSLGISGKKGGGAPKEETEQQKNSKTWSSYFPSGKGFSSYIPKSAGTTVSAFAEEVSIRTTNRTACLLTER